MIFLRGFSPTPSQTYVLLTQYIRNMLDSGFIFALQFTKTVCPQYELCHAKVQKHAAEIEISPSAFFISASPFFLERLQR